MPDLADDVRRLERPADFVAHVESHARRLSLPEETAQKLYVLVRERNGRQRGQPPRGAELDGRGVEYRVRLVGGDEHGECARIFQLADESGRAVEVINHRVEVCAFGDDQRDAPFHLRCDAPHVSGTARANINHLALDRPLRAGRPGVRRDGERAVAPARDERGARRPALPGGGHAVRLAPDVRESEPLHLSLGPLLRAARVGRPRQTTADPVTECRDVLQLPPLREDLADDARRSRAHRRRLRAGR